jgi:carboxypeptidase-like protein
MNRLLLLFIFVFIYTVPAMAQATRNVSGVVTSAVDQAPLEGVTVIIKGTKRISGTQPDGAFYIDVEKTDTVIVFQLRGYESKEVKLTNSNEYPVILLKQERNEKDFASDRFIGRIRTAPLSYK